ncbi:MAG: hypothetical protein QME88_10675 [Actinomycetota bacterium]|nr:hypothetical protein [Actinomycetota bacterium]
MAVLTGGAKPSRTRKSRGLATRFRRAGLSAAGYPSPAEKGPEWGGDGAADGAGIVAGSGVA